MAMLTVWPTDAGDGAVTSEARWRKMARLWTPTGVVRGAGGEMVPSFAAGSLTVKAGACWVDGHYAELDGDQVLAAAVDGLAVVRFDPAANTCELLFRAGATTPTQTPGSVWELAIAYVAGGVMGDRRALLVGEAQAFPNVTARALNVPAPVPGQVSYLLDTGKADVYAPGGWGTRPQAGTIVRVFQLNPIADANTGTIWPGWAADLLSQGNGTSFPYPTKSIAMVTLNAGFGVDWIQWNWQLFTTNGVGWASPLIWGNASAGYWGPAAALTHIWDNAAGQDVGYRLHWTATAMGGNATNVHTGGEANLLVLAQ